MEKAGILCISKIPAFFVFQRSCTRFLVFRRSPLSRSVPRLMFHKVFLYFQMSAMTSWGMTNSGLPWAPAATSYLSKQITKAPSLLI